MFREGKLVVMCLLGTIIACGYSDFIELCLNLLVSSAKPIEEDNPCLCAAVKFFFAGILLIRNRTDENWRQ